jgi:CheY-like chemotaxis protein
MSTILVVDDSAVDRRLIGGILESQPIFDVQYAENGMDALNRLKDAPADLVITDLQMPKMDGLKLVQAIGLHHPQVPVILITGRGSEDIAVEALQQGAASYVPKSQLHERLLETVTNVISRAHADSSYQKLIQCSTLCQFHFRLDNDLSLVDPLIELVQQIVVSMGLCDARERLRIGVALEQALLNAMFHGNLELDHEQLQHVREQLVQGTKHDLVQDRRSQTPFRERKAYVTITIRPDEARFIVRDEGKGFDVQRVPRGGEPERLAEASGRGLTLMTMFMDDVRFNDSGNEVTLVKHRHAKPA